MIRAIPTSIVQNVQAEWEYQIVFSFSANQFQICLQKNHMYKGSILIKRQSQGHTTLSGTRGARDIGNCTGLQKSSNYYLSINSIQ